MQVGTVVLCDAASLHLAQPLSVAGFAVHGVTHRGDNWVGECSISMRKSVIAEPSVLIAEGTNCELLPSVGWARRSAHKPVGAYVLINPTTTPQHRGLGDGDWPDAPVIVLTDNAGSDEQRATVMQARLRGWTVLSYIDNPAQQLIEVLTS